MAMMKCPKCGFEQPEDQFCAKCGVNVSSYKPTVALSAGLSSLLKPVLFVLVIIGLLFFLFKNVVEKTIIAPELEVQESTQLGVGASSLNTGRNREVLPAPTKEKPDATNPLTAATSAVETEKAEVSSQKFNQVSATFTLAEHGLDSFNENDAEKSWRLLAQTSPINSFATEDANLKLGDNTFDFVDDQIRYHITLALEEITDKDVKIKLNMRRALLTTNQNGQSYSVSIDTRVPLDQSLLIVDSLPRNAAIDRPNSVLSTLYKSRLFLSHASELVQIIKFNNPSNLPQE